MDRKYQILLPNQSDNKYLNKLRYEQGYNPFSYKFNNEQNEKLLNMAVSEGASESTIDIIRSGGYFNKEFHLNLSSQLMSIHKDIKLSKERLMELFVAMLNEQELLNRDKRYEFINNSDELTAFNIQNGMFVRKDIPNNPQNFVGVSESMIELGNLLFTYLVSSRHQIENNQKVSEDAKLFQSLNKLFKLTNKYYNIKDHYEASLFHNGIIRVENDRKIYFNPCVNDMFMLRHISNTILTNQRLNRYSHYEEFATFHDELRMIFNFDFSIHALSSVKVENGFVKYKLRKRNFDDYSIYLDCLVSIYDYYPFYYDKPLLGLGNLTVSELLCLFCELRNLVSELYNRKFPERNIEDEAIFKNNFLPRIRHSVLKSFLLAISSHTEYQIELFIKLLTVKAPGNINLYETHLLSNSNYYYFPYFSLTGVHHLYMIDYWLEQAGEPLDRRGKALEKYLKNKLHSIKKNDFNKFNLINQSEFVSNGNGIEEIDILIQTKKTLIIGEVKCVKYPFYDRDFFKIYNDAITYAEEQLDRKSKFIINNKDFFKEIYSLEGKRIIKVIILNYPIYVGGLLNETPIIDCNFFLSYFDDGNLAKTAHGKEGREVLENINYYNNEDEFCDNLESYLSSLPMVKMYSEQFKVQECSYKNDDLTEIFFVDVLPNEDINLIYE